MKILKSSSFAVLALGGLLALSPALCAQDTNTPARPPGGAGQGGPGGGRGGMSVDDRLARLSEQLALTDEQKPKVKALLEEQIQQRGQWRDLPQEERRAKFQAAQEEFNKKMKGILTEEQYKKFEALPRFAPRGQGGPGEGGQRPRPGADNTNAAPPAP